MSKTLDLAILSAPMTEEIADNIGFCLFNGGLKALPSEEMVIIHLNLVKSKTLLDAANYLQEFLRVSDIAASDIKEKDGATPIFVAASNGYSEEIKLLAYIGVSVDAPQEKGWSPMMTAAFYNRLEVISVLASLGASTKAQANDGATAMYIAAQEGFVDLITLLNSLDPELKDIPLKGGSTPIYIASKFDRAEVVASLISLGADAKTPTNDGWTPIYTAAQSGAVRSIEALVKLGGVDPNTPKIGDPNNPRPDDGATPMHIAALQGFRTVVEKLISLGAIPNPMTRDGRTPNDLALKNHHNIPALQPSPTVAPSSQVSLQGKGQDDAQLR